MKELRGRHDSTLGPNGSTASECFNAPQEELLNRAALGLNSTSHLLLLAPHRIASLRELFSVCLLSRLDRIHNNTVAA